MSTISMAKVGYEFFDRFVELKDLQNRKIVFNVAEAESSEDVEVLMQVAFDAIL